MSEEFIHRWNPSATVQSSATQHFPNTAPIKLQPPVQLDPIPFEYQYQPAEFISNPSQSSNTNENDNEKLNENKAISLLPE